MFADFFIKNLDIVFAVYGLSFVGMGIAVLVQPRRESIFKLSDIIWILAGFGLSHGLNEWLDMFAIVKGYHSNVFNLIRLTILAVSYVFLFEFGRRLIFFGSKRFLINKWVTVVLCFLTLVLIFVLKQERSVWPRYLLGLPGGLLSAFGFVWYYKGNKTILMPLNVRRYFLIAAFSIGVYSILGGIVTPKADFFPASIINNASFLNLFGIPVQVFRAICGVILAWSVWNILSIFNWEIKQKLKSSLETLTAKVYVDNLIKSMIDSLIVIDPDAKIKTVNKTTCELLGYKEEELIGKDVNLIVSEEERIFKGKRFRKLLEEGSVANYEMIYRTKKGNLIPMLFSGALMKSKEDKLGGIVGIAKDITERKKIEDKLHTSREDLKIRADELAIAYKGLEKAQDASLNIMEDLDIERKELDITIKKLRDTQAQLIQTGKMAAMGQLGAGIAHELNQPLSGIRGFSQIILYSIPKDDPNRELLDKIVEQTVRMEKIIANVRTFARQSAFEYKNIDINQCIDNAVILFETQLRNHKIILIKEYSKDLPLSFGDSNQLQQVFVNLIANAKDALDEKKQDKKELIIKTLPKDNARAIEIQFIDSGMGIPEDIILEIFNPFFTTKDVGKGTGLGLSISHGIIENHAGTIEAASKKDIGTTVSITLPAAGTEKAKLVGKSRTTENAEEIKN